MNELEGLPSADVPSFKAFRLDSDEDEDEEADAGENDWGTLGLDPLLLKGVIEGFKIVKTTPVQRLAVPAILSRQNVIATAETGSGKTLAFALPICQMILEDMRGGTADFGRRPVIASGHYRSRTQPLWTTANTIRAIVLSPTREIAMQTQRVVTAITQHTPITSTVICGGTKHATQEIVLRRGVNFICACPGRLLDVLANGLISKFKTLRHVVLDEADRMLGLGFAADVSTILQAFQENRLPGTEQQVMLFSASLPAEVLAVSREFMGQRVLRIGILEGGGVCRCENIEEGVMVVPELLKLDLLRHLLINATDIQPATPNEDIVSGTEEPDITRVTGGQCIIFTRTKARANRVCEQLRAHGFAAERIHGNRSQAARVKAMHSFVSGGCQILVATDVAARGIDIYEIPLVVNFDVPNNGEEYTHRAGRTGRAGHEGQCWTLVSEMSELEQIHLDLNRSLATEVKQVRGFDPSRQPSFVMTTSGHEHEITPAPVKPPASRRSLDKVRTPPSHSRRHSGARAAAGSTVRAHSFTQADSAPRPPPESAPRPRRYGWKKPQPETPATSAGTPPVRRRVMNVTGDRLLQLEEGRCLLSSMAINRQGKEYMLS